MIARNDVIIEIKEKNFVSIVINGFLPLVKVSIVISLVTIHLIIVTNLVRQDATWKG